MRQRKRSGLDRCCETVRLLRRHIDHGPRPQGMLLRPLPHHARPFQNEDLVLVAVGVLGGVPAGGDLEMPHRELGRRFRADQAADATTGHPSAATGVAGICSQSMTFMACALCNGPLIRGQTHFRRTKFGHVSGSFFSKSSGQPRVRKKRPRGDDPQRPDQFPPRKPHCRQPRGSCWKQSENCLLHAFDVERGSIVCQ